MRKEDAAAFIHFVGSLQPYLSPIQMQQLAQTVVCQTMTQVAGGQLICTTAAPVQQETPKA